MLTVGIDIDGVLVECNSFALLRWAEAEKGLYGAVERFLETNDWEKAFQLPSTEVSRLYHEFEVSPAYPGTQPIAGARDGLQVLKSHGHSLCTLTARPLSIRERTLTLLEESFGRNIFLSHHFQGVPTKRELVQCTAVHVHIEDNHFQALSVADMTQVILFPGPLNVHLPRNEKCIHLEASRHAHRDMPAHLWQGVWQSAWEEIPHLLADLVRDR